MPSPRYPPALEQAVGLSWRFLVLAAALALAAFVLYQLRLVVVPAVAAMLLSTLLVPPVDWLRRQGWPRLVATGIVLLGAGAVVAGAVALVAPAVADEVGATSDAVEEGLARVEDWLVNGPLNLSRDDIDRYVDLAMERVRNNGSALASGLLSSAYLALEVVAGTLLALVLTFFFVKDGDVICGWALRHVDERHHALARALGRRAWATAGAYLRGMAVVGAVDAAVIGIGLAVIGVPLVGPLAALTFVGAFFPLVGATVAGVVAALVALVSGGLVDALLVAGLVVLVQQVEGDVLAPLVMGRTLRLHPVVIVVVLTAGAVVAGMLGAFLAVPVTAVAAAIGNELRCQPDGGAEMTRAAGADAST